MNSIAYTYLIGWSKLNIWYYGLRFAKGCNPKELWKTYFTSSKHVKMFTEYNGNPDIIEIRKKFHDVDKARKYEHTILRRLKAKDNPNFLNLSDNISISREASSVGAKLLNPKGNKRPGIGGAKKGRIPWNKYLNANIDDRIKSYANSQRDQKRTGNYNRPLGIIPWNKGKSKSALQNIPKTMHVIHLNKTKIICPFCKLEGQLPTMKRWHFNRCKLNPSD